MARIKDVVVDCRHPASLARFWAAVLDGYDVAPYNEAELARLRDLGIDDVEDDPTVLVFGASDAPSPGDTTSNVPTATALGAAGPVNTVDGAVTGSWSSRRWGRRPGR